MKIKFLLVSVIVGGGLMLTSCGNDKAQKEAEAQRIADSIRMADSIQALEAEAQRVADSLAAAEAQMEEEKATPNSGNHSGNQPKDNKKTETADPKKTDKVSGGAAGGGIQKESSSGVANQNIKANAAKQIPDSKAAVKSGDGSPNKEGAVRKH